MSFRIERKEIDDTDSRFTHYKIWKNKDIYKLIIQNDYNKNQEILVNSAVVNGKTYGSCFIFPRLHTLEEVVDRIERDLKKDKI